MVDQAEINAKLAEEIAELKIRVISLAAYIAALPGADHGDMTTRARTMLAHFINPEADRVGGDQLARGMYFVQLLFQGASTLKPFDGE